MLEQINYAHTQEIVIYELLALTHCIAGRDMSSILKFLINNDPIDNNIWSCVTKENLTNAEVVNTN